MASSRTETGQGKMPPIPSSVAEGRYSFVFSRAFKWKRCFLLKIKKIHSMFKLHTPAKDVVCPNCLSKMHI